MLKLKMMLCVMMLPLVVVGCTSKAVCQSVREATTASGVDNAASPDWQTPLNGIISPGDSRSLCKNNWKNLYILMPVVSCPYRWATHAIIVSNIHGAQAVSINAQSNKTEQSIYECLLVSVLTFSAPQIFGRIDSFLLPNSRNGRC